MPKERSVLIQLARIGKNDVFYDLGSGHGRLVVDVVTKTAAKRAVGIEVDYKRFCNSVRFAQRSLSKVQLKRIDFYCANYFSIDFSDATVVYEGHNRERDEIKKFDDVLNDNARIITLDLPFIRCRPIKTAVHRSTKFFMMHTPFAKSKAKNKNQWASWVLDKKASISDVYDHYDMVLKERGFSKKQRRKERRKTRDVVNSYF